jgi:hypothetical protein
MVVVNVNQNHYKNVMMDVFKETIYQVKTNAHHALKSAEHVNHKKIVQNA